MSDQFYNNKMEFYKWLNYMKNKMRKEYDFSEGKKNPYIMENAIEEMESMMSAESAERSREKAKQEIHAIKSRLLNKNNKISTKKK